MKESPQVWLAWLKEGNDDARHQAKLALGGLTPAQKDFVPELIQALRSEDSEVRFWAATALACIRSEAEDAVPELIKLLQDQVFGNRQAAVHALGRIGAAANPAVPALANTLKNDRVEFVRQEVVRALQGLGTPDAVEVLIGAMDDRDKAVRRYAAISLKMLGPRAKQAIPALRRVLTREKDRGIRDQVEAALRLMGDD